MIILKIFFYNNFNNGILSFLTIFKKYNDSISLKEIIFPDNQIAKYTEYKNKLKKMQNNPQNTQNSFTPFYISNADFLYYYHFT